MAQCGRCGREANELHAFRARENDGKRKREKLCGACHSEARDIHDERIRAARTRQWAEARTADGRFDPAKLTGCQVVEHDVPAPEQIAQENARWDRIFQRFIDPDYYRSSIPTLRSSFGAFASEMEVLCR